MGTQEIDSKTLFCAKYLQSKGLLNKESIELLTEKLNGFYDEYTLLPSANPVFIEDLAEKLRLIWPTGEKEGKYPWRCSVKELKTRLLHVWIQFKLGDIPIEKCLRVARKYVSQFQDDKKYMKLLKYFVMKQCEIHTKDGKKSHNITSTFVEMLQSEDADIPDETEFEESQDFYDFSMQELI